MKLITKTVEWARGSVGITVLGLVGNVALSAAKVLTGIFCYSQTIFVDGLHSASDSATDIAVLAGLRISGRPADASHHYGHRRAMTLVTAVLALVLLGAGAYVGYRAILGIREPAGSASKVRPELPLAMAILSIVVKEAMYQVTVRVGRRVGDMSLVANAWHHRSDAFSSVAAAAGLAAMAIGGHKWHFLDHLTALVLSAFLAVVAWRIVREAVEELMDRAPSRETLRRIQQSVAGTRGVRSFHAIRARRLGGKVDMDIHVQVDPELTVRQGHEIAAEVRRHVMESCPEVLSVIVHVEPPEDPSRRSGVPPAGVGRRRITPSP